MEWHEPKHEQVAFVIKIYKLLKKKSQKQYIGRSVIIVDDIREGRNLPRFYDVKIDYEDEKVDGCKILFAYDFGQV